MAKFEGAEEKAKSSKRCEGKEYRKIGWTTTFDICKRECEIPDNPKIFNGKVTAAAVHGNTEFDKMR